MKVKFDSCFKMGKHKCCCCKPGPRGPPGNANDVVWRPYYSGLDRNNIVATPGASGWERVFALLSRSTVPRTLYLDPTDAADMLDPSPFVVPRGNYDMSNVTIAVSTQWSPVIALAGFSVVLVVEDGATFNKLLTLEGPFIVEYRGTSTPAVRLDISKLDTNVYMKLGATVVCSGSQPFWQFFDSTSTSSQKGTVVLDTGSFLLLASNEVVDNVDVDVDIIMVNYCVLGDNTLSSTAGGSYTILFNDPLALNNLSPAPGLPIPFDPTPITGNQPAVFGGISLVDTSIRPKSVTPGRIPLATDDNTAGFKVGDMWVDAGVVYAATGVATGAAVWLVL